MSFLAVIMVVIVPSGDAGQGKFFHENVAPILVKNCIECHNSSISKGGLNLETLASALKGGDEGAAIVLGKPLESLLYQQIVAGADGGKPKMPKKKPALKADEAKKIHDWIANGAGWPKDVVLKEKARADASFWSLQPVVSAPQSDVGMPGLSNPLDVFIARGLRARGLALSPQADKRALIRRLSLDLIGLPPTPGEIQDFLADQSPQASGRVVERLLASPRYGERWARHWLDVARFSESDGFEEDMQRQYAYTYRDYVINAFNQDKAYDLFVREQIAGDVGENVNGESIAATGFLVAGPWDAVQRVTPSKLGRLQSREEQLEEIVAGVSQAFLGLSVQCARCHDHKFDPIPQQDYYRVKAVFEGVDHSLKPRVHGLRRLIGRQEEEQWLTRTEGLRQGIKDQETKEAQLQKRLQEKGLEAAQLEGLKKEKEQARLEGVKLRSQLEQKHPAPLGFVGEREQPQPTVIFQRGDIKQPGGQVAPGPLSAVKLSGTDFEQAGPLTEAQRRLKFAHWLAHPDNPLTFRVMVNRLWQYHFGVGIVDTPSDFGFHGGKPSHPELLDWLASEFKRSGYSIKHLHRLIVSSATYQQASAPTPTTAPGYARAQAIDADNRLLWRFPSLRLEGEVVRDALLGMAGNLNHEMGGPSFKPYTVTQLNTYFYHLFDRDEAVYNRRSIYRMHMITGRSPLLDALDCPSPSVTIPKRAPTTTALQALALMNDSFVVRQAMKLAQRLQEQEPVVEKQIGLAFELAFARQPTAQELAECVGVAGEHGLATVCWALVNSSEFLYNH